MDVAVQRLADARGTMLQDVIRRERPGRPWLRPVLNAAANEYGVCRTDVMHRSLCAAVVVYNLLPAKTVEVSTVKAFQSHLQFALRNAARKQIPDWQYLLSPRFRILRPAVFQSLFF